MGSEAIDYEISRILDAERRRKLERIASISIEKILVDKAIAARALEIENLGLGAVDALHASCAEGCANVRLTTDEEIISAALRKNSSINIKVSNPVRWLLDGL
jgi:hypothetical protein